MSEQPNQAPLLKSRRFLPLFVTQFLGAANDNVFKNALAILIIYRIGAGTSVNAQVLVTASAGLFILPFFLFSATAGQLADKYEKARLIRIIKFAEILLMSLGAVGFFTGNPWFLLAVLFLLGAQATFFGPLKYAILPDHLREDELVDGNAWIEGGTFLAILLGTITGGLLILTEWGIAAISALTVLLAALGWLSSLYILPAGPRAPHLRVGWNIFSETAAIMRQATQRRDVFLSILGISWFWLVGATFLSQFPAFAKDVLNANEHVVTLFLTVFSV
ncbi:MAG: MFS transporter, partial [Rhodospirillales bacterium]|nr:MFS transporter [Rhodospirillales bacterium]